MPSSPGTEPGNAFIQALPRPGIRGVTVPPHLREVSCLYGFTRFEPSVLATDDLEDVGLAVDGAPLGRSPTWLPAVELFGEGIFLTFDPAALQSWLSSPATLARARTLNEGTSAWVRARRQRGLEGDLKSLG